MASAICLGWESCAPWPRLKGAAVLTPLPRRSGATVFSPRWLALRQAAKTSRRGPETHAGKRSFMGLSLSPETKRPEVAFARHDPDHSRASWRRKWRTPARRCGSRSLADVQAGRITDASRKTLVPPSSRLPPYRRAPFTLLIEAVRTNFRQERIIRFFSPFFSKINPAAKSFAGRPKGEHEDGERFRRHGLRG